MMRNLLILSFFTVLLLLAGNLSAQIETRSDDYLEADDALPDTAFFAAQDLNLSIKSDDDVFAIGADISINDAQADHMFAAGGDVAVSNVAFRDLIIVGGDMNIISGSISDDLAAAGGDVRVEKEVSIGGSALVSGGDIVIDAPIDGELRAAGARLRINAPIGGDAYLAGERVLLGPETRIEGDLRHRAQHIEIDPDAEILGETIRLEPPARPDLEAWAVKAAAAAAVFAIAFFIGVGVLVVVIALALPALMNSAADMISQKPLSALGLGFLITVAAPIVIGLLFASIFGIPLALLIAVAYAATAPLALAAFAYFLGMRARAAVARGAASSPGLVARAGWSAIAAAALVIVGLIPIFGGLVWLIAYTFGLGAVMTRGGKALAIKA